MGERCYLKWYNKIGYGAGDMAANMIYSLLTSFVLIYLTDTVGLNAGIVGVLIMFARLADGISDIFFGRLIDKTKTKMGKARPWMLFAFLGNAVTLIAIFAVPESWGMTAQYIYFFITYLLLNAVFYTANNIAYSSLTSLITKNGSERVQMGSIRMIFAFATALIINTITINAVSALGGGVQGWRNVAVLYAVIGVIINTISVFSVKELPESELIGDNADDKEAEEKTGLLESVKLLLSNKYYVLLTVMYITFSLMSGMAGANIYYMMYVLGDASLLGIFSSASMFPLIIGLALTPLFVKLFKGIYKVNLYGFILALLLRGGFIIAAYRMNIPMMLLFMAIGGICTSTYSGTNYALISAASEYTCRTSGKRIDGMMFSCTSLGQKVGVGVGTALSGWLLEAGGYVANAAVQPQSCINMLNFMFIWVPTILTVVMTIFHYFMKVEKANADWDKEHGKM